MAGFLEGIKQILGLGGGGSEEYKIAEVYDGLRGQILAMDPVTVGLTPDGPNRVWGMLMETGYRQAVATLVVIGDGTVSLYFSNGGGIIGAGQHEGARMAGLACLDAAPEFLGHAQPTTDYPLPAKGITRFCFLTFDGILTAEASENDLGYKRHPLSPLFHKAQDVITQIRMVDGQRRR